MASTLEDAQSESEWRASSSKVGGFSLLPHGTYGNCSRLFCCQAISATGDHYLPRLLIS